MIRLCTIVTREKAGVRLFGSACGGMVSGLRRNDEEPVDALE
ncbi:hypothetical protein [Aurantiacibacter marinus]|nr:hypothetical protein [Aurantiacibacter marinus]